jgi:hypothetical protein
MLTVPMGSVETIVDGAGKTAVIDSKGRLRAAAVVARVGARGSVIGMGNCSGGGFGTRGRIRCRIYHSAEYAKCSMGRGDGVGSLSVRAN